MVSPLRKANVLPKRNTRKYNKNDLDQFLPNIKHHNDQNDFDTFVSLTQGSSIYTAYICFHLYMCISS